MYYYAKGGKTSKICKFRYYFISLNQIVLLHITLYGKVVQFLGCDSSFYINVTGKTKFCTLWEIQADGVLQFLEDIISRASLFCPSTLNTVAAMCDGVRPASANWSAGDPWSIYRSGRTSGLHCKLNGKFQCKEKGFYG